MLKSARQRKLTTKTRGGAPSAERTPERGGAHSCLEEQQLQR